MLFEEIPNYHIFQKYEIPYYYYNYSKALIKTYYTNDLNSSEIYLDKKFLTNSNNNFTVNIYQIKNFDCYSRNYLYSYYPRNIVIYKNQRQYNNYENGRELKLDRSNGNIFRHVEIIPYLLDNKSSIKNYFLTYRDDLNIIKEVENNNHNKDIVIVIMNKIPLFFDSYNERCKDYNKYIDYMHEQYYNKIDKNYDILLYY